MTKTKSNRIFLGIVTGAMALAGTGLTFVNNFEPDLQIAAIALTLAACFTAAEATFLWGHKRFETSTRLWRKFVLSISLGLLVFSMGYAVWEELKLALAKVGNRSLASNSAMIVQSADKRLQRGVARDALKTLSEGRVVANAVPFVLCYIVTGLVSIAILACTEKTRERRTGVGNLLLSDAVLQRQVAEKFNLDPSQARAYVDRSGKGAAVWHKSKQIGYLSFEKPAPTIYDSADDRKT